MKRSPKRVAVDIFITDLELVSGYYSERGHEEYDQSSEKRKDEINRHMQNLHTRIEKILRKARGEK